VGGAPGAAWAGRESALAFGEVLPTAGLTENIAGSPPHRVATLWERVSREACSDLQCRDDLLSDVRQITACRTLLARLGQQVLALHAGNGVRDRIHRYLRSGCRRSRCGSARRRTESSTRPSPRPQRANQLSNSTHSLSVCAGTVKCPSARNHRHPVRQRLSTPTVPSGLRL
jgi:hypothetical protein